MEKQTEGKLSRWQKFSLRFHAFMCKNCGWFFKQTEFLREHSHNMEEHVDATLTDEQKLQMEELLNREI